ncbi:MAG: AAA family ATPase, partial [Clostridia bacterium]|nr:AAA family ATPase [Clostridia bacterium]
MKGLKTVYICSTCEYESPKWMGKCPKCGAWNSFVEDVIDTSPQSKQTESKHSYSVGGDTHATPIDQLEADSCIRSLTGLGELDRVLGGGLVKGSVVLLTGEPGIGKSTLLLQISGILGGTRRVLYISGEESSGQLKLRAARLGVKGKDLLVLTET